MMSYEEVIRTIESTHRFGPRPGLGRMRKLMARLGNPQDSLRFVHVAGTNGKGTTCTLISSVLCRAGYRTGLYLSPHVEDFRERMQIDGAMIPRPELAATAERVFPVAEEMRAAGEEVAEFELVTATALLWFAEKKCDIAVLEVGLGGRLDATNVIAPPLVSALVSLSLDHTAILGGTIEKIAAEKCGILKKGSAAVCAPGQPPEALAVIRRTAKEREVPLTEASEESVQVLSSSLSGTELLYRGIRLHLPFLGAHQVKNAVTALAVLEKLRSLGWSIPADALAEGFASARIPARLEVLSQDPPVLLDGAHNPGGTAVLAASVHRYLPGKKVTAVMGMLADKDVETSVQNLAGAFSRVVTVAPSTPRALSADALARIWRDLGVPAEPAADFDFALRRAFSRLEPDGAAVLCGSLYLAGDLRQRALRMLSER